MSIAESSRLTCPNCNASGYINLGENEPKMFLARGQFEGDSVVRCTSCGGGMFVSVGHGWPYGQPKRIDDDMWQGDVRLLGRDAPSERRLMGRYLLFIGGLGLIWVGWSAFRVQFTPGNLNRYLPPGPRLLRMVVPLLVAILGFLMTYWSGLFR